MRHRPDALMLFAAGFGTRMGALTQSTPKPLLRVAGKPLIDHSLDLANACGFKTQVANLHYLANQLATHLSTRNVQTVVEAPEILETGGGLRNALPLLGNGPIVTSNTDAVWHGPNPFELALETWSPDKMDALLVCVPMARCRSHSGKGDFILAADGRLTRGPQDHVYGGIQILKTDLLPKIQKTAFSLNVLWNEMLDDGRLFGLSYPGHWCDVGSPEGIKVAESMLRELDV